MTIRHLVLGAGGPILGLYAYGILSRLSHRDLFDTTRVETIHGCSAGSILGALLCLRYEWEDLTEYIVRRPWDKIVDLDPEKLFSLGRDKGILDRAFFEEIFSTLLLAKDLSVAITLKELYDVSGIDLHIYTVRLSGFEYTDMSHATHPDVELIDAVYMSSAIPFVFKPAKHDGSHYIDGGVIRSFPLETFLASNPDVPTSEVLGIALDHTEDAVEHDDMTLVEYATFIYKNHMRLVDPPSRDRSYVIEVPLCFADISDFVSIFQDPEMRAEVISVKAPALADKFADGRADD